MFPRRQDAAALSAFLHHIQILDFPDEASLHYARIRADLRKLGGVIGTKIGANDLFISRVLLETSVEPRLRAWRVSRLVIEHWTL